MTDPNPTKIPHNVKDLQGQRFGKLLVVEFYKVALGKAWWKCLCDCGRTIIMRANNLRVTRTCGCSRRIIKQTLLERFEKKYIPEPNSGCWLWTASLDGTGYGQIAINKTPHKAHRISYRLYRGIIPNDLPLDHLCRVRCCVNPTHLEAVTMKENILRGVGFSAINARKTHCPKGHPFEDGNFVPSRLPYRLCLTCLRESSKARYYLSRPEKK